MILTLDHVNIITADLEGSARFYAQVFGLERRDGPPPLTPQTGQWMYDEAGRAVIHLNSLDAPRAYDRDIAPGPTGALHHVALACSGHDAMIARLEAVRLDYQRNFVTAIGLRQIFVRDPNEVLFELNFFGD
ncbi:VOC family protein [Novosphingobium sediminicola]|uniref:Catechol 2,3-dioxygenase-like lactoylglutathione lyase family enzyme n=1 Tax=Novosphingobium sediminicola TaxID=563162 RepID=A0A7W6CIB7_9SPHN|nr:VOC family protein [Novosphingobium sediminicola]MBB3955980.1 catechol 2,3-dioxygenase-like lactoylglutathione lyase family enzyme [Novosphingobium sediminicola]